MDKLDTTTQIATAEAVITSAATKWGMGGGTLAALYGWLSSSGAAMFIGIVVTILGFVINGIYQQKRHKRETEEAEFRRQLALAEDRRQEEIHLLRLEVLRNKQE